MDKIILSVLISASMFILYYFFDDPEKAIDKTIEMNKKNMPKDDIISEVRYVRTQNAALHSLIMLVATNIIVWSMYLFSASLPEEDANINPGF